MALYNIMYCKKPLIEIVTIIRTQRLLPLTFEKQLATSVL